MNDLEEEVLSLPNLLGVLKGSSKDAFLVEYDVPDFILSDDLSL